MFCSVEVMVEVVNSIITVVVLVLVLTNNKQKEINLEEFVIFMKLFLITKKFYG